MKAPNAPPSAGVPLLKSLCLNWVASVPLFVPNSFSWRVKVEYAIEAINNAGTCVGILAKDGIVMAAERKVVSKLLAPSKTSEKTYR